MPSARSGTTWKLARPFHGPFRVVNVKENGLEVCPVDRPRDEPIRVSLNQVRRCPDEVGKEFYPRRTKCTAADPSATYSSTSWEDRLRSRRRGRPTPQAREM